jgi:hypothetical protein
LGRRNFSYINAHEILTLFELVQILVFSYNKILVPYDGSKPSGNALQQAIRIVNDSLACGRETTTNSMQEGGEGIQIILLHVVEEIHVRFPNMYIGLRIIAGKPLKEFFKEVYEEMSNEASKMLDDIKKRIELAIQKKKRITCTINREHLHFDSHVSSKM